MSDLKEFYHGVDEARVTVMMLKDLDREAAMETSKIYLVDEADHAMEENMVTFNLRGDLQEYSGYALFALCKRSYHFTATLSSFCRQMAANLFRARNNSHMFDAYASKIQITEGKESMVIDHRMTAS